MSGKALASGIRLNLKFILKRANWVAYYLRTRVTRADSGNPKTSEHPVNFRLKIIPQATYLANNGRYCRSGLSGRTPGGVDAPELPARRSRGQVVDGSVASPKALAQNSASRT